MAKFRARARTVDMLGRQQIAGLPTAISELFKNAHDAYADHVEVDFYRSDSLFVLRDDGVGMTQRAFEERWLTLGTESKLDATGGVRLPPADPGKALRPILGEKGIGRLAIAALGPQVLVLTRAKVKGKGRGPLVAAFIHWGIFKLPGVDLDQIEFPVRVMPDGVLPDARQVREMVAEVRANFESLKANADEGMASAIRADLAKFKVSPAEIDTYLKSPSLSGDGHGTHFFIMPADDSLRAAIDRQSGKEDDSEPPLTKMLIGFTNTMTPGHPPPLIQAAFRDHHSEESSTELIGEQSFFTPEEFREADHHIEGTFDAFGQFEGTVTVYAEPTHEYKVPWPAAGRALECGPFRINLAVVQGNDRESTLPTDDWVRVTRKLNRIGGLYIYKDGIRVLPYGNNDYDFLNIERNRTKSASYYYFSYRRIMGVIEIDREHNSALSEKAGREGFRENKAYREFSEILKNFFVQVAADFFRDGGVRADRYTQRKAELDRVERARRMRDKQVTAKRNTFRVKLEAVLSDIAAGKPAQEASGILEALKRDLKSAAREKDQERAATAFLGAEAEARRALTELREGSRVAQPRGVGLPKAIRRDFDAYSEEYVRISDTVFDATAQRIEEFVTKATVGARDAIGRRLRFDRAIEEFAHRAHKDTYAEATRTKAAASDVSGRVVALAQERLAEVDRVVRDVISRAARIDVVPLEDGEFVARRTSLEREVEAAAESGRRLLSAIGDQLRAITWESDAEGNLVSELDMTGALEEELIELRERTEADLELSQLGMAIQIINHEFDATIKAIRSDLRQLRAWADANEDLRALSDSIRRSFDHLDGYLTMFTPLQRRMYRKAVRITGAEIYKFLGSLFEERLSRHEVSLEATPAFKRYSLTGFPSTYYPVFVNLVDNALFWLSRAQKPRIVLLDASRKAVLISNSGPPVEARDREAIFELGFTRKPGGRGLGLHISRQVLAKERYALTVQDAVAGMGATFRMEPVSESDASDDGDVTA